MNDTTGPKGPIPAFDVRLVGDVLLTDQALSVARWFASEYPDRIGRGRGVIYADGPRKFYVYRTPAGQVVVRSASRP